MNLRFIHFGVGGDYHCDIELFRQLREFKDGVTFLEGSVNLDLYKADHKPSFELTLIIFNFTIFEIVIYNINHVKDDEDQEPEEGKEPACYTKAEIQDGSETCNSGICWKAQRLHI